ncbi:MAG: site-specific integrase [Proteobacteria bacterium]|nr:MAG: site-specific integrase [Pseudomonadota bacterium]
MGGAGSYTGIEARGQSIRVTFSYKGKRRRETLTLPPTPANLKYAARLRGQILNEIGIGSFNYAEHFPESNYVKEHFPEAAKPKTVIFSEVAGRWLRSKSGGELAKGTLVKYRQALSSTWLPLLSDTDIRTIKYSDILEIIGGIDWPSAKTRNNALIPLRQIFEMAYLDETIDSNPMERIKNLKVQKTPPDPLSKEETDMIIDHIRLKDQQAANYYQLSLYSGMRPEEIIAIRWSDYDSNKKVLRVQRAHSYGEDKTVKNENIRDIDLTPQAIEAIENQKQFTLLVNEHIFHNPATNKPWDDQDKQRINYWNPALKKLGIRHRRAYETRHTYATMLLMAGCNPAYAASQMGHSLQMFFSIYARWIRAREDAKEHGKLNDFLGNTPSLPHKYRKPSK